MTQDAAVEFHNMTLGYDGHPAVHHLSGGIRRGSLTAVIGPNGSGKSTLIKGIVGSLKPLEGTVQLTELARNRIAYLPQQADIDRTFPINVFDFVSLGLWSRLGAWRAIDGKGRTLVERAIAAVGLTGFEERTIDVLSGGQLQRVLFARVLVQDSPLILLDEPFTAIDAKTAADLMGLIERWHTETRTVLVVMHDLNLVKERFPEALMLARELIAWGKAQDVVTPGNLLKARAMSEAWDEAAPWCNRSAA